MRATLSGWGWGLILTVVACSSGGDGGTEPGPNPAIAISLNPTGASVVQGGSTQVTATLTRSGGFTGTVTFTAEGAPPGVTASVGTPETSGGVTTAVVTVTVGAATSPGSYSITIRGTGSGVSPATATFSLTVTALPSFTIAANPAAVTVVQTLSQQVSISITRINYPSSITLTAENLPPGLTATFEPASTTGNSSTLTLTAGPAVATGAFQITIRGTGPDASAVALRLGNEPAGLQTTATLAVTVGAANMTLDYTACDAEFRPIWMAYQDGTAAWQVVTPMSPNVYRFHVSQSKGGFVFVAPAQFILFLRREHLLRSGGRALLRARNQNGVQAAEQAGFETFVFYGSVAELVAASGNQCPPEETIKTVFGNVTGMDPSEYVFVNLGGSTDSRGGNGPFELRAVRPGVQDFIAYVMPFSAPAFVDRMVIRRDQDFPNGATMPTVDMSAESFLPDFKWLMVNNAGTDDLEHSMHYLTTNQCRSATLYVDTQIPTGTNTFYGYGPTPDRQRANDFFQVVIEGRNADFTSQRSLNQSFHSLQAQSAFRLPDPLPPPTITMPAAPYRRLGANLMIPADYLGGSQTPFYLTFVYFEAPPEGSIRLPGTVNEVAPFNVALIFGSQNWFGGAAVNPTMPDFSGLSGWNNAWGPSNTLPGDWLLLLFQANGPSECAEGYQVKAAFRTGNY